MSPNFLASATLLTAISTAALATSAHSSDSKIFEADGHRSIQWDRPAKKPASKLPLSMHFGVDVIPAPVFQLQPLDHAALMLEDQMNVGQGPAPFRFGVSRDLLVHEADGQWVDVPTGKLWRIEIQTTGAENARLGVAGMDLPEGSELRMYMKDHLEMIAGPFTDDGPMNNGEAWSITMPGDTVVVEYLETGKGAGEFGLPFAIDQITHGYLPILKSGGLASSMGNCHNDTACYSEWNDLADAAALIIFSGGYLCSGQLIATSSNDETPYYITANHCVSTQGGASGAEFRFRYERTTCTGSFSQGSAVSGSTLVATWSNSDNTLLRITGSLPSWVYFAGWTTADPPNGTPSTCIHFPGGDYSKISFCNNVSNGVCGSSSNYIGTSWTDAVTEQGSSGSALYRNSDQKLYGVLTCGASSCFNPSGLDGYGRFSRAYENGFDAYLGIEGDSDDSFEPNDSCSAAVGLSNGNYSSLAVLSTSDDWYRFSVGADATFQATLDFSNSNGDIDVVLYSACGGTVLDSGTSNTNDETVTWTNDTGQSTNVYMYVYLDSGTYNQYSMAVSSGGGGGGDGCDNAQSLTEGDVAFNTTGSTTNVDLINFCDLGEFGDEVIYNAVIYRYSPSTSGTATVSTCDQASFDTRLSAHLGDCEPSSVITCLDDTEGCGTFTTSISFDVATGNDYYIVLGGYDVDDAGTGTLTVSVDDGSGGGGGGGGGGGDCPSGFTADCQGTCFPDQVYVDWQGDTYCDDGSYIPFDYGYTDAPEGVAIFMNCDAFDCDSGDCTGCDGGGGGGGGGGGDDCEPTSVTLGDNSVDTSGATGNTLDLTGFCDPGEFGTDAMLNTAFYEFIAPATGPYVISTCNQANWDTRLSVHSEDCSPESVIVCLDDTPGCEEFFTTTLEFDATAGSVYVIGLGGYSAADFGPATLTISGDDGGGGGDPTGACCQDYSCSILTEAECTAALGAYIGDGTTCETNTCNPEGACCFQGPGGGCAFIRRADCESTEGKFYGDETCATAPCDDGEDPTGACCQLGPGQECYIETEDECNFEGGNWVEGESCKNACGDDCPGDFNNDGTINGSDLTILLGNWGSPAGDLNGDNNTDGADLTLILANWGDC